MKKILTTKEHNINIALNEFNIVYDKYYNINDVELVIFNEYFDVDLFDLVRSKGIKFFGGNRLDKLNQYFLLSRLNINTPKVFYNKHTNQTIRSIDEFNAFVDLEEFVVKPPNGARGIGVKKINRQEWKDCFMDRKKVYNVFKDEFVLNNTPKDIWQPIKSTFSKEDIPYLKHKDEDISADYIEYEFNKFIIQEPIDVKREFRLIFFTNGEYLTYERVKNEGQFCGNLSHGSTPNIIEKDSQTDKDIIKPILKNVFKLIDELNYPWLSIDLYEDTKGNVGIFEFQMEFSYEGFDYKDIKREMVNCLNYLIAK